jgi:5-(carboxyamino)imidazole ribonucleotide synthase|tara:strand:- start:6974 stop:8014 length:1041 start_codon:yes stop_codon:yes gene_type:complete
MIKKKLGILGGGQLGMFICQAAKKYKIDTIVFSNSKKFSAKKFCDSFFIGDFNDEKTLKKFINSCDFITIETENIPKEILKKIEYKKKLFPSACVVEIAQNRLKEKKFLNSIDGVNTVKYKQVTNLKNLKNSLKEFNNQAILKSCEMGYDGKGQYIVDSKNVDDFREINFKKYILEEIIDFKKEISIIVCCTKNNTITYPPVENFHTKSILRETTYPAKISEEVKKKSIIISKRIAKELKLVGILAVEMFLLKNDEILINELAPRPHNSGHWTIDYCKFSQFENLILSIFQNFVKEPNPTTNCKMVNVIGDEYKKKNDFKKKFKFYDYFKDEIKDSRKMGHYTLKN